MAWLKRPCNGRSLFYCARVEGNYAQGESVLAWNADLFHVEQFDCWYQSDSIAFTYCVLFRLALLGWKLGQKRKGFLDTRKPFFLCC
jgi:hypothetical protein